MDLHLADKVAVVTGASKGIGLAVTRSLAEEGAHVVAGALHGSQELELLADRHDVRPLAVDLTTVDGPATLVAHATDDLRRPGRAGEQRRRRPSTRGRIPRRDRRGLDLGADDQSDGCGPHDAGRAAVSASARRFVDRDDRSVNAFLPDPSVIDYSAAKGALANFCKSLSKEFASRGVRVNTVSPGPVATDLWLGDDGVAATVGRAQGIHPDEVARHAARGQPDRTVHLPAGGRRPRRVAGQRPRRQHHRRGLRHRRRPHQHPLTPHAHVASDDIAPTPSERLAMTSNPPVVFIHGLWLHSSSWQPWVDLFRRGRLRPDRARLAR